MKGEKIVFKENIPAFSVQGKIAQYFRFAEKSGDNHPTHFRKLIMQHVQWYENTDLELFVQKCYKSREKYVLT
jgi:hypothetical protein